MEYRINRYSSIITVCQTDVNHGQKIKKYAKLFPAMTKAVINGTVIDGGFFFGYTGSMNKSAVVAIIGRPSAGKSSFLNAAGKEKISIVSPWPQTTRKAVRGIVNRPEGQLIFIDTPGYHKSDKKLNLKLKSIAEENLEEADILLYVLDSTREAGSEEELIASLLAPFASKLVVAVNKIDSPEAKSGLCRLFVARQFPTVDAGRIFDISAKTGEGVDDLIFHLLESLPMSPLLYPAEFYTDQDVPFRISEIIREQIILNTKDEVPHSVYVKIENMKMKKNGNQLEVEASLFVDKESQKGILIGKDASLIKKIRINAEKELFSIFPYYISLQLRVKTDKNWKQRVK